ncbi:MAG: ROK family protein [Eubacteriales bacterium]|nr:ROK family protein [Eubacteriales bacterium]
MRLVTLDIGGTEIKSALFSGDQVIARRDAPSHGADHATALIEAAAELIGSYEGFEGVGIACTGQVDSEKGVVTYANDNVPELTGMPIGALLEDRFHVPVTVDNDANAAALGEGAYGAARGCSDFLCLTYGTGVGGGIVIGGRIYNGRNGSAGELGHIIVHAGGRRCACGLTGCYESYASTTALVRAAQALYPEIENGRQLFAQLDALSGLRATLDEWIEEVSYGLISLTHAFNPALLVLGGGVMAQPYVLEKLKTVYERGVMPSFLPVELKQAALGNLAGAYGALAHIQSRLREA